MKYLFTLFFFTAFVWGHKSYGQNEFEEFSDPDKVLFQMATEWDDSGNYELALEAYNNLLVRYPNNEYLLYEKGLTLYNMKRPQEAIPVFEKCISSGGNLPISYTMLGNCYDVLGESRKAIEIYEQGYEKFPTNSIFLTEIGNVCNHHGLFVEAIKTYEMGMMVEPARPQNYFRAATLEFKTAEPIWGLIYAETSMLLSPNNHERFYDMSRQMAECYLENTKAVNDTLQITLFKNDTIQIKTSGSLDNVKLNPGLIISKCYSVAMQKMINENIPIDFKTIETFSILRRYMVDTYYESTENIFGDSMYLLEFQKSIINAGHWDAYTWFIFSPILRDDGNMWLVERREEIEKFVEWYNEHIFTLNDGRTVCSQSVKVERSMNIFDILILLGKLEPHIK